MGDCGAIIPTPDGHGCDPRLVAKSAGGTKKDRDADPERQMAKEAEEQEDLLGSLRYCRPEVDDSENI